MNIQTYLHPDRVFFVARCDGALSIAWKQKTVITDQHFVEHYQKVAEWAQAMGPATTGINFAGDFSPSATQRRMAQDWVDKIHFGELKGLALVTDSAMVRGALTAMAWFFPQRAPIRGFRQSEQDEALRWLKTLDPAMDLDLTRAQLLEGLREVGASAP